MVRSGVSGMNIYIYIYGLFKNSDTFILTSSAFEGRFFTTVPPGKSVDGYDLIVKTRRLESDF